MLYGTGTRYQGPPIEVARDSAGRVTLSVTAQSVSAPWWLSAGIAGDVFVLPASPLPMAIGEDRLADSRAQVTLRIADVPVTVDAAPIIYRYADPARGERRHPLAAVPPLSVMLEGEVAYARAGVPFDRLYHVQLKSASSAPRGATLELTLPQGLRADSAIRRVALDPFGSATLTFRIRGMLAKGRHTISAVATSEGQRFAMGYLPITYEHIRPLRYFRPASVLIEAVDANLPANPRIAYIQGVGDNVAPMLTQLGLSVTILAPDKLGEANLGSFGAIVVGPRAFAAHTELVAQAGRLQDYARAGGTVVVQYGQQEIQRPGILPYPVKLAQLAQRVTDEQAPVRVLDPTNKLLVTPNRITAADFDRWVQERAVYMPSSFDPHYAALLEMHDPGEPPNESAILVAPVGKGAYVYTTLALFRQLPAGVPGAARLFLNLIAADGLSAVSTAVHP
jgi:hypothetical protein